jgi:hypothetical protein
MNTEPQKQHQWLQQLVGEWSTESEMACEPGQPPQIFKGTDSVRSLGGLWVLCEGRGEMPGGEPATMIMTLGYDPRTGRFVGSWVGSMMTHLWVYDGWLDEAEKLLTLESEGPSFSGDGTLATYRDVIEIKSADHRVLTSQLRGVDGQWGTPFMTAHYRRRK